MAALSDVETKAELACARHLNGIASAAGITVHAGVDPANLPLPHAVCMAVGSDHHIPFSGQFLVDVEITIESSADDTSAATHRDRIARVRDEFNNDWVGASLNTHVSGFVVAGAISTWGVLLGRAAGGIEDSHWRTVIPIQIHCGVTG